MKLRATIPALLVCCGLALSGCGTLTNPGAPDQSFDIDQDIQDLEDEFKRKQVTVTGFYATPAAKRLDKRNEFIGARLTLINIQYIKFIRRFAVEKAQLDTAADMLVIGVDLAGTLVGAASTKAILAAISGGTSASRISINKNFFQQKTVPVLITAMNAERKAALLAILRGRHQTLDVYSFEDALSDLHIYYQAGTFLGALQSIQKDSGVKEEQADEDIKDLLIVTPVPEDVQKRVEKAAAFVKNLGQTDLDSLAKSLGKPTGNEALIAILDAIAAVSTANAIDVIAQKIKTLFDKEI